MWTRVALSFSVVLSIDFRHICPVDDANEMISCTDTQTRNRCKSGASCNRTPCRNHPRDRRVTSYSSLLLLLRGTPCICEQSLQLQSPLFCNSVVGYADSPSLRAGLHFLSRCPLPLLFSMPEAFRSSFLSCLVVEDRWCGLVLLTTGPRLPSISACTGRV